MAKGTRHLDVAKENSAIHPIKTSVFKKKYRTRSGYKLILLHGLIHDDGSRTSKSSLQERTRVSNDNFTGVEKKLFINY